MTNFECSICLGILKIPFECPNCHNNFCKEHINQIQRCPLCNMKDPLNNFIKNISLERIIDDFEFQCPKLCGFKCRGPELLEKHLTQCNFTQIQCVLCQYQGSEEMFWAHLLDKHKKQIINQFGKILQNQIRFNNSNLLGSSATMPSKNKTNIGFSKNFSFFDNAKFTHTVYEKPEINNISNLIEKSQTSFRKNNSDNNVNFRFSDNFSAPIEPIIEEGNNSTEVNNGNINLIPSLSDNNSDFQFRGNIYDTKVYDNLNFTALSNNTIPYNESLNNNVQNGIDYSNNINTNINGNTNINTEVNANINNNINTNINANINNNINTNINSNANGNINNNINTNINNIANGNINNYVNANINNNNKNTNINNKINTNINNNVNVNHHNKINSCTTNMNNIYNINQKNINYNNNIQQNTPNSAQKAAGGNYEVGMPKKKYIVFKQNTGRQSPECRNRRNVANVNFAQINNNRQIFLPNAINTVSNQPIINQMTFKRGWY